MPGTGYAERAQLGVRQTEAKRALSAVQGTGWREAGRWVARCVTRPNA